MDKDKAILFLHIAINDTENGFHADFGVNIELFAALPNVAKSQLFIAAAQALATMMQSVGVTPVPPPDVASKN